MLLIRSNRIADRRRHAPSRWTYTTCSFRAQPKKRTSFPVPTFTHTLNVSEYRALILSKAGKMVPSLLKILVHLLRKLSHTLSIRQNDNRVTSDVHMGERRASICLSM